MHIKGPSGDPADQNILGIIMQERGAIYILTSGGLILQSTMTGIYKGPNLGAPQRVYLHCSTRWNEADFGFLPVRAFSTSLLSELQLGFQFIFTAEVLPVSKDTILVTTDKAFYDRNDFNYRKINDSLLNKSNYMSIATLGSFYLLATSNKGLIIIQYGNWQTRQFTTKNGLNADFIYSVVTDNKNQVWLGTGRGV